MWLVMVIHPHAQYSLTATPTMLKNLFCFMKIFTGPTNEQIEVAVSDIKMCCHGNAKQS